MIFIEVAFLLTLLFLILSLKRREGANVTIGEKPQGFSIIIPFKNEEKNLSQLLESLSTQRLSIPFEVILIDDSSTDNSVELIKQFNKTDISYKLISSIYDDALQLSSKQQAIETGVTNSQYDWLVFTDADMVLNAGWLHSIYETVDKQSVRMTFGRTGIIKDSIFSIFQHIQLQFLFASAWFLSKVGMDSSCMGNNIAIEKELYLEIGGQRGIGYSIVEDKKLYSKVRELGILPQPTKHFYTFAFTKGENSLLGFMHQQMRWLKGGMGESKQLTVLILLLSLHIFSTVFLFFMESYLTMKLLTSINWIILATLFFKIFFTIKAVKELPLLLLYFLIIPFEAIVLLIALPFWKVRWKGKKV